MNFRQSDTTLDALCPKYQRQIDAQRREAGWPERQWQSRFSPAADHSGKAWQERLAEPLTCLFNTQAMPAEVH